MHAKILYGSIAYGYPDLSMQGGGGGIKIHVAPAKVQRDRQTDIHTDKRQRDPCVVLCISRATICIHVHQSVPHKGGALIHSTYSMLYKTGNTCSLKDVSLNFVPHCVTTNEGGYPSQNRQIDSQSEIFDRKRDSVRSRPLAARGLGARFHMQVNTTALGL